MTAPAETPVETTREWTDEEAEEVRRWSETAALAADMGLDAAGYRPLRNPHQVDPFAAFDRYDHEAVA